MYQAATDNYSSYNSLQVDRLGAARRLGNGVLQRGRGLPNGRQGRLGPANGYGTRNGHPDLMTVVVPWTPQFGTAYQQFINGGMQGMSGSPMGGMGSFPMGGMGGSSMGGMQGMSGFPMGGMGGSSMGGMQGMSGFPMGGMGSMGGMNSMGGSPMGGYGAGRIQGVPIGFGVTTN